MSMTSNAVVFDLDGTLVDTLPDLHTAVTRLLTETGLAAPSSVELRRMVGDGARKLVARALTWSRDAPGEAELDAALDRFLELYNEAPCVDSRLFANVEAMLHRLAARDTVLGVCTNKPQRPTEHVLGGLGIAPRFAAVVGGDAVERRKPHPDHLRLVLERIGADPDHTVMVGDSKNDLEAARGCGLPCILVDFGYSSEPVATLGADRVISDFAELDAALDALSAC